MGFLYEYDLYTTDAANDEGNDRPNQNHLEPSLRIIFRQIHHVIKKGKQNPGIIHWLN